MTRADLNTILKGLCIGGTMLVPGVSGGTMAMILGIYDQLVVAVASFRKQPKANLLFLTLFLVGSLTGMLLFASPLLHLIENYPLPSLYFFLGAVSGGVPFIYRKAKIGVFHWPLLFLILLGFFLVLLLSQVSAGVVAPGGSGVEEGVLFLLLTGIVAAVALVLPGISVSYLLLLLGMYDKTMLAISTVQLSYLIPLGSGLMLGILLTTKLLERLMTHYPQPTYLIILGFIGGSLVAVFPGLPTGWGVLLCPLLFAAGFAAVWWFSCLEQKKGEQ